MATEVGAHSTRHSTLLVRTARGMGRGVFAGRPFRPGEVIEVCPVLLLPGVTTEDQLCGGLNHYVFKWGRAEDQLAIALGYGSLYNHSSAPNAKFRLRVARGEIVFRAVREITAGDQILVDYGWEDADYAPFVRTA